MTKSTTNKKNKLKKIKKKRNTKQRKKIINGTFSNVIQQIICLSTYYVPSMRETDSGHRLNQKVLTRATSDVVSKALKSSLSFFFFPYPLSVFKVSFEGS